MAGRHEDLQIVLSIACLTGAFYEMDWLYHAMDHFI
jgi:hypothetical protein